MKNILYIILLSFCFNAELLLVDGSKLYGNIISSSDDVISIQLTYNGDIIEIERSKILNIDFNSENMLKQNTNSNLHPPSSFLFAAGDDLTKFRNQYYIGAALQFFGYILLASADDSDEVAMPGVMILIGGLIQLFSYDKIGDAGAKLKAEAAGI